MNYKEGTGLLVAMILIILGGMIFWNETIGVKVDDKLLENRNFVSQCAAIGGRPEKVGDWMESYWICYPQDL